MTNREAYNKLSESEKTKYNEIYSRHPLAPYINWQAYYDSEDGNTMHFVDCIGIREENDEKIYLLQKNGDVYYAYNSTTNEFVNVPVEEKEVS